MNKTKWFITGINRGLGHELAKQLLAGGATVFGTARNLSELESLKEQYPKTFHLAKLDMVDSQAIRTIVRQAFTTLGHIDAVVSNAGYSLVAAAEEATDCEVKHQIDVNLVGSITLAQAALPFLRKQQQGRLIQISSSAGQSSIPGVSLYVASKWGIEGFYEALAKEIEPFNIRVTIVEPGGIRTDFAAKSVKGTPIAAYASTPAGEVRDFVEGGFPDAPGDPTRMAKVIISSLSTVPAPFRLVLGSDSYMNMRQDLERRLAQVISCELTAPQTDFPLEDKEKIN